MAYDPERHHRRTMRWEGYDYASAGAYVVTVVTRDRRHLLGAINDDVMVPSAAGGVVEKTWFRLPERFPTVTLDAFVVMPNHIHGIIILNDVTESEQASHEKGRACPAPTNLGNQASSDDGEAGNRDGPLRATVGAGPALPSLVTAAPRIVFSGPPVNRSGNAATTTV